MYNCSLPEGSTKYPADFKLSFRKSYYLTFTGIYFHPDFYCPFPLCIQILLPPFYIVFICDFLISIQSSAKSLLHESMFLQISFTYPRNSSGPKTLPCGTPEVTLTSLDSCPSTLTIFLRPTRNSLTQMTTFESTPEASGS
jgi:hypothetical protein